METCDRPWLIICYYASQWSHQVGTETLGGHQKDSQKAKQVRGIWRIPMAQEAPDPCEQGC